MFDQDYADIAAMLNKSEASCRQLVHRAQARVQQERPRFEVPKDMHRDLLARFMQAVGNGDRTAMKATMSDDVQLVADGGGKVNSFQRILHGAGRVAGVYWTLENQNPSQVVYRAALVNGEPGLLRYVGGKIESVQSFIIDGGRIVAVFIIRNPDKLTTVPQFILIAAAIDVSAELTGPAQPQARSQLLSSPLVRARALSSTPVRSSRWRAQRRRAQRQCAPHLLSQRRPP